MGGTRSLIFSKREMQHLNHNRPEKKMHQGHVSFYVKNVDLISLRQKYDYKEHEGKNDKNRPTQTSAECAEASCHQWT
jgi:hypothetical protein